MPIDSPAADRLRSLIAAAIRKHKRYMGQEADAMADTAVRDMLAEGWLVREPGDGADLLAWLESLPKEPTPELRAAYALYRRWQDKQSDL